MKGETAILYYRNKKSSRCSALLIKYTLNNSKTTYYSANEHHDQYIQGVVNRSCTSQSYFYTINIFFKNK